MAAPGAGRERRESWRPISVTAQRPTLEPKELRERLVAQVMGAAAELSHQLNYRPAEAAA